MLPGRPAAQGTPEDTQRYVVLGQILLRERGIREDSASCIPLRLLPEGFVEARAIAAKGGAGHHERSRCTPCKALTCTNAATLDTPLTH